MKIQPEAQNGKSRKTLLGFSFSTDCGIFSFSSREGKRDFE